MTAFPFCTDRHSSQSMQALRDMALPVASKFPRLHCQYQRHVLFILRSCSTVIQVTEKILSKPPGPLPKQCSIRLQTCSKLFQGPRCSTLSCSTVFAISERSHPRCLPILRRATEIFGHRELRGMVTGSRRSCRESSQETPLNSCIIRAIMSWLPFHSL